jgi:hypothetical protein
MTCLQGIEKIYQSVNNKEFAGKTVLILAGRKTPSPILPLKFIGRDSKANM